VLLLAAVGIAGVLVDDASAQRRGRGGFGGNVSRVDLSTLPEVQSNLMLSSEQKTKVNEIAEELRDDRRELFQDQGGGNFAALREPMNKLTAESTEKLMAALEEQQKTRLNELFVQVNGAGALADAAIAKSLSLSDAQTQQVNTIVADTLRTLRESRQEGASREERQEAREKATAERDTKLLAVLSDEQKQNFDQMKGEALDIDLSQMFRGRGGQGN
jgi:hypothetical protein